MRKQLKELEEERTIMKAKESHLTRQLFRFENMNDSSQLEYFTGLSRVVWNCVWKFLKPTEDNVLSEKATKNAGGICHSPWKWTKIQAVFGRPTSCFSYVSPFR